MSPSISELQCQQHTADHSPPFSGEGEEKKGVTSTRSRDNVISILTMIMTGEEGFPTVAGQDIFMSFKTSRPAMGSWALRLFSKGKADRPEINNSPSTSAEVKKEC
jgi:hypothetical protein